MTPDAPFGPIRLARAADGAAIGYAVRSGDPGAPRVALLHSLALDHSFWSALAQAARGSLELLAIDCRGHGASAARGPFSAELMADDLAAVLDAAGWARPLIAGASMGGSVALAFAARHPARTAALLAIDTTAWYGPTAPADWARRGSLALTSGMAALLPFQRARWLSVAFLAAHPEVQAAQEAIFLRMDVEAYAAACAMLGTLDLRRQLPRIEAPTIVLVGAEDGATPPAMARQITDLIAGAELRVLDGARHLTPLERPADIAAALRALAGREGVALR